MLNVHQPEPSRPTEDIGDRVSTVAKVDLLVGDIVLGSIQDGAEGVWSCIVLNIVFCNVVESDGSSRVVTASKSRVGIVRSEGVVC